MKKLTTNITVLLITGFAVCIVVNPKVCIESCLLGVLMCGRTIIPSILPFTFCVLFINQSGILNLLKPINKITTTVFGLNYYEFSLFALSLVGGYPLGAKLLSTANINPKKQDKMINFCINAGPAFVIMAVGVGVFKSVTVGWILFISQILSSLLIAIIFRCKTSNNLPQNLPQISILENFTSSITAAAQTVFNISAIVILFSAINGYIKLLAVYSNLFLLFSNLLEITNAVFNLKNIIKVSFLLGFAGVSIWFQVLTILKNAKINYLKFIAFRFLHGTVAALITLLLLKTFKVTVSTFSNNISVTPNPFESGPAVAISLIIFGIVLIISLYDKKYAGNLIEDIV